jgi:hypothetical protein
MQRQPRRWREHCEQVKRDHEAVIRSVNHGFDEYDRWSFGYEISGAGVEGGNLAKRDVRTLRNARKNRA